MFLCFLVKIAREKHLDITKIQQIVYLYFEINSLSPKEKVFTIEKDDEFNTSVLLFLRETHLKSMTILPNCFEMKVKLPYLIYSRKSKKQPFDHLKSSLLHISVVRNSGLLTISCMLECFLYNFITNTFQYRKKLTIRLAK